MEKVRLKEVCYICGDTAFHLILDLGSMPPANAFLNEEEFLEEEVFPLVVRLCDTCKSLGLQHVIPSSILFKNYHYATGASTPLVEHFHKLAEEIIEKHIESPNELVIEIGSNDGSLLCRIKDRVRVLGVDPAENVAQVARKKGVPTTVGYFDLDLSHAILADVGPAKVVVANNVMAHIDNITNVFSGVKNLLSDTGVFIFEVHWVGNLLTDGGFDQIYHEHLYYHSLSTLQVLFNSIGMVIVDVQLVPIHGESMRVLVSKRGESSERVQQFLDREGDMGLTKVETYKDFSKKVEANKKELTELLTRLKAEGKKIVGYGAPAKGNTLLNYFKIGRDIIDYLTDTTVSKQGKYAPGSRIPVVSPEQLKKETPDYVLLLSWNYADSILEKEKELRERGVKFIIPVPYVKIV